MAKRDKPAPSSKPTKPVSAKDEDILEEIRERFSYATKGWREIRDEADEDMRYVTGDVWTDQERADRKKAGRPCLNFDELGQFTNQTINDLRRNKRGIKVSPQGNGATDQTAELRQSLIRQIEYRSNASTGAYTQLAENAIHRGYGFARIYTRYVSPRSLDQELLVGAIPDPDNVTPDPDAVDPTGADWSYLFYTTRYTVKEFARKWPNAQKRSFTADDMREAPDWYDGENVLVAEYWKVEPRRDHLYIVQGAQGPEPILKSELPPGVVPPQSIVVGERAVEVPEVCQYLTNGIELLETESGTKKHIWPGKSIPFVMCPGKVYYVKGKRILESQIRKAREPQKYFSWVKTKQAEMAKLVALAPVQAVEGQMRGHEAEWAKASDVPVPYLYYKATTEDTGPALLPPPTRLNYGEGEHIMALEQVAEGARRSIQAAMGISPLPTAAQRRNEKSGVALQRMEESAQVGSYHFVDHFEMAITRVGAILDELIPAYYDAARDVTLRQPDDEPKIARINDPNAPDPAMATVGEHDVTITVGPAHASQREAAETFGDALAGNPQIFPLIADLVVKMKQLGPVGDEIAERLVPPQFRKPKDGGGPPSQAEVAQMQMQLQQMGQALQQAQQVIETEQAKQQATIETARIKAEADVQIAKIKGEIDKQIAVITAAEKARVEQEKVGAMMAKTGGELEDRARGRMHDAGMAERQRQFDGMMAERQAEVQRAEAERQRIHEAAREQGD